MASSSRYQQSSSSSEEENIFFDDENMLNDEENMVNDEENMSVGMLALLENMNEETRAQKGSVKGRRYIHRDRVEAHNRIMRDYFVRKLKYPLEVFRRRFRMQRQLFLRILKAVSEYDNYFTYKVDGIGKPGLKGMQKMVACIRLLAYGCAAESWDEYVQIAKSTLFESLRNFCDAVMAVFEDEYLRAPNEEDIQRLLRQGESRGFPGMLGSLDCMYWQWDMCPTAWQGTYIGHKNKPTIILEAVADRDLWIWHAFFGIVGSNNDINVLQRSHLFDNIMRGNAPPCNYTVNGREYHMGYYLADGIYPKWATLVQTIPHPTTHREAYFAKMQEACRKDVERAFGVLQGRWGIIKRPVRMWSRDDINRIMKTCIILHNMIVEDEREMNIEDWEIDLSWEPPVALNVAGNRHEEIARRMNTLRSIHNIETNVQLRVDLVNHLWEYRAEQGL